MALLTLAPARALGAGPGLRPGVPEPLVGESITDIDAAQAGEVEVDLDAAILTRTRNSRTGSWSSSIEAEWRANEKLGLAAELQLGSNFGDQPGADKQREEKLWGLRVAASWAVWNDFRRELHLQAEVSAALFYDDASAEEVELGAPALPYVARLHGAWRAGRFNLRLVAGAGWGPVVHHLPVYASAALLWEAGRLVGRYRRAFFGVELGFDGGRRSPLVVIPEVAVHTAAFSVETRIGLAAPLLVGLGGELSPGALLRITVELDRD